MFPSIRTQTELHFIKVKQTRSLSKVYVENFKFKMTCLSVSYLKSLKKP